MMKPKTILHIFTPYLKLTFIYFFLKSLHTHSHYVLTREIKSGAIDKFPFKNIIRTHKIFYPIWFLNKIFIIKYGARIFTTNIDYKISLGKIKPHLLHAHFGTEGYYALSLANSLRVPLIVTFYGFDMSTLPTWPGWDKRLRKLFKQANAFIVEGEHMKSKMMKLGCSPEKIYVSRLAIPIEDIQFNYRPRLENELRILMCANFVEKKGYKDAFFVLKKLYEKGIHFKCEVIGDGRLEAELKNQVKNLGLNNSITFLGRKNISEIYEISKKHHVFFHPSRYANNGDSEGGAPTIISEMQALGLPIVSTTHADIPNNIPYENQFLAAESDIDGLCFCFEKLLEKKDLWNIISEQGRKFVAEKHDQKIIGEKMEIFYEQIIQEHSKNNSGLWKEV